MPVVLGVERKVLLRERGPRRKRLADKPASAAHKNASPRIALLVNINILGRTGTAGANILLCIVAGRGLVCCCGILIVGEVGQIHANLGSALKCPLTKSLGHAAGDLLIGLAFVLVVVPG